MGKLHSNIFDMSTKPTATVKLPPSSRRTRSGKKALKVNSSGNIIPPSRSNRIRSNSSSALLTKTPNSFAPITAHYDLNQTLYKAFYKLCDKGQFKTALSVGIQYCRVALWDIPQHSYYDSPKYSDLKNESAKCALDISELLPAVVRKVSKDLKAKGEIFYKEKVEEVKLLNDVSKEHYHSIARRSPSFLGKSMVKKEVLEVDEGFPSWLKALDCGDGSLALNLCMPKRENSENQKERAVDTRHNNSNSNNSKTEKKQDISSPHLPRNPYQSAPPFDFSRTTSAPAHLGKFPSSNRGLGGERREPPPTVTEEEPAPFDEEVPEMNEITAAETKSKEVVRYESDLERALYLSGLEFQATSQTAGSGIDSRYQNLKPVGNDAVAFQTLSQMYRDDFEGLRKTNVIQVSYLDTYQGRVRESVNGCTVIAPLLAIHHLCDDDELTERNEVLNSEGRKAPSTRSCRSQGFGNGVEDDTIRMVIDIQAPQVLPRVREKLCLPPGALIIPSDVHDFLIEENFLLQQQFVEVFGGNILDDGHLSNFVDYLSTFGVGVGCDIDTGEEVQTKKVAATFFFHEHVVSLHRITRRVSTSLRYKSKRKTDDTKPGFFKKLRGRKSKSAPIEDITTIIEENTWFEIIDSLPGAVMLNTDEDREQQTSEECYSHLPATARIRCNDKRSLHAALRWYACSKFTSDDQKFIDSYQWDDMNMEFDPRVFQSFVWSSI